MRMGLQRRCASKEQERLDTSSAQFGLFVPKTLHERIAIGSFVAGRCHVDDDRMVIARIARYEINRCDCARRDRDLLQAIAKPFEMPFNRTFGLIGQRERDRGRLTPDCVRRHALVFEEIYDRLGHPGSAVFVALPSFRLPAHAAHLRRIYPIIISTHDSTLADGGSRPLPALGSRASNAQPPHCPFRFRKCGLC